jgi:hypothetical protein
MTALLQEVFQKASVLPEAVQDMLARELLAEIEWENQWDSTFENSQSALEKLTLKAMQEYREGKTTEMGFDEL